MNILPCWIHSDKVSSNPKGSHPTTTGADATGASVAVAVGVYQKVRSSNGGGVAKSNVVVDILIMEW
jgi:hypothetical protein